MCLPKSHVEDLVNQGSLWNSFSAAIVKTVREKISIKTDRGKRYYGPSKTSYYNLFYHSFTIMSVFKKTIFFRSFIISIIYTSLIYQNVTLVKLIPFFFLSIFLSMIFTVSRRENLDELKNSLENIEGIETLK